MATITLHLVDLQPYTFVLRLAFVPFFKCRVIAWLSDSHYVIKIRAASCEARGGWCKT